MLKDAYEEDKTYEEMLAEALMQIPLYSEEWTNHNPSDPGITILENLTAFEALDSCSRAGSMRSRRRWSGCF